MLDPEAYGDAAGKGDSPSVTADTAARLAVYFGTTVDLWLNLQAHHEAEVAWRSLLDQIRSEVQPRAA